MPRLVVKSIKTGMERLLKQNGLIVRAGNLRELNIALAKELGGRPEDFVFLTGGDKGAYTTCKLKPVSDELGVVVAYRTLTSRERAAAMAKAVKHPVVTKKATVERAPRFVNYPQVVTA